MDIVNPKSLGATLDAVNDAFFHGRVLSKPQRQRAAAWITRRQGLPGAYADMFAPTDADRMRGIRAFTGEKISSRAATAHILGEEACRTLILLGVGDGDVGDALQRVTAGMLARLENASQRGYPQGTYCCGTCSCSYWRHLAVGGLNRPERRLAAGLEALRARRRGDGLWQVFPFWYTLLALSEIDLRGARVELLYAAPICERYVRRSVGSDRFARRRRALAERVLGKC